MQGWKLPSLLYHPYLVSMLFGMLCNLNVFLSLVSIFTPMLHNHTHLTSTAHFTVCSCAGARVWIKPHERGSHFHAICASICDRHKNKTYFLTVDHARDLQVTNHQLFWKGPGCCLVYWSTINQAKKILRRECSSNQTDHLPIISVTSSFTSDRYVTTFSLEEGGACFMWL